jgi:hypothetical protein
MHAAPPVLRPNALDGGIAMQTLDLQEGEEVVVGDVRVAVLEVKGRVVVLRIAEGDDAHLECLEVPPETNCLWMDVPDL